MNKAQVIHPWQPPDVGINKNIFNMNSIYYLPVAVIINNKKVLFMRRAPSERFAGYWKFSGGKVEVGEIAKL